MPKNQRRANQGGGAERHGRDLKNGASERGQAGYNTSVAHRETRAQDGKDHHGAGARRSGAVDGERRAGRQGNSNLGSAAQVRGMKQSSEKPTRNQHDDTTPTRVGRDGRIAKGATKVKAADRKGSRHAKRKGAGPAAKKKGALARGPRGRV